MDLRQMEYFQMVCRLNNLTRAAERLHVAQPAISVAMQKLEEELGVQLFSRSQKQFTLTTEGQVFLARVEDILSRTQDAILEMHEYRELRKGTIKLGVPPMIGSYLFPHIFAGFKQVYPSLDLSVIEEGSLAIRGMLERDELDLGIVITCHMSPLLQSELITSGEILVCLSPFHPLAGVEKVDFAQLRQEPFILLKEDTYHRQVILQQCKRHNFEPNIILASSQIDTIRGLVARGVGISFLFDVVARKDPQIQCVPLVEPLCIEIGLAWKKDRYLSKASQAFLDYMSTLIAK
ncbi:DNA-binding transcriptional LysR family regulator [Anaerospora hongkongensis]|uniref:DNA-binding transcriptional LysR family regulator n=1 Tax=Anaerospora hongkongensis TaxID=244830 RepID=A0A4V2Q907_9FIRM|nr:LysR family transcriptional regulator [Anaerospora hongkongensis]TCL39384.1 DNA-binding transcriptional LysR family regulator [Anaerospora hongkongensis]